MDFIFVSMPYTKFDSKWFANVPNINLGIADAYLSEKGKDVKTFHFHLDFLPFLDGFDKGAGENLKKISQSLDVEYLGLDYVFASLLFEKGYQVSKERFAERLGSIGLALDDFETLRKSAWAFIDFSLSKMSPHLPATKLVGFTCSHYQLSSSLLMCFKIKNAHPHVLTVVGGKDCSGDFAHDLLSKIDFLDFVAIGECEVTIPGLLEHIEDSKKPLFNVLYRDGDRKIKNSELLPNVSLNSLPFPRYHLEEFPIEKKDIILPLELGRGCPWEKCTFCPDESYYVRCQSKTPGRVKAEMEYYQSESKDLRNFFILDSDALKKSKSVIELSEYLDRKGFSFHFAEFRAQKMDKKVLESLLRFGRWVSPFQVGIETFSDRVLKLMKKGVTVIRNVEVLKMVAELGIPLQFNLFTSYPNMTLRDLEENLKVMDLISHLLVYENILIYPGEFYLPTDCPIFLNIDRYDLKVNNESIFSDVFDGFPMPSYSNYPYPYEFDNEEEQLEISARIREKVEEIKSKSRLENFVCYETRAEDLKISVCRDGQKTSVILESPEKEIYLSAVEKSQRADKLAQVIGISTAEMRSALDAFESQGLILWSADRNSFLSLATRCA
jgi:radical SAM superfamily enzyme YgiQ (UPF0313 family)